MPTVNSDVHMMSGLQSAYDSMQSHDTNTLYFCTDTQRYFIGDVEYSRPVQYGTSLPSKYLPPNSLFYNANTRQLFFSKDGASWQVISSIPSINGVELNGNLTSSDLDIEPARFIVNVTGSGSSYTADHTYAELVEAYNEGRTIQAVISGVTLNLSQFLSGVRFEFQFSDLQYMEYAVLRISVSNDITFNSDNIVIGTTDIVIASSSSIGGVYAKDYNESNYQSTEIAIDSSGFLHAPKLSINGIELTNSTTLEDLNLKGSNLIVNVTQSGSSYIADKTFEEINAAIDSGSDCICYITLSGQTMRIPYVGKIGTNLIVFQQLVPAGTMIVQITIDNTNVVTIDLTYLTSVASSNDPGVVYADSDTYDETYTKECKMNYADGKLYCQPTMWSFWD